MNGLGSIGKLKPVISRAIADGCLVMIEKKGMPIHVSELYVGLMESDFQFKGIYGETAVSMALNSDYRFVKVRPRTFDIRA